MDSVQVMLKNQAAILKNQEAILPMLEGICQEFEIQPQEMSQQISIELPEGFPGPIRPGQIQVEGKPKRVRIMTKNSCRHWTAEDDEKLSKLLRWGFPRKEIEKAMGRSKRAVQSRLSSLGLANGNKHN